MLLGRSGELEQLHRYYDREGSQIVVVYGQKYIGKTALIKEFVKDKPVDFYVSRACSEKEQVYQWSRELAEEEEEQKYLSYDNIFMALTQKETGKKIIVVEEFQNMVKAGSSFMKQLVAFINREKREVLVLLCTSSVGFVENSMIKKIGEAAYALSGLIKIKELKFRDCRAYFHTYSKEQCIEIYAILGGMPGLWNCFSASLSVKENIIQRVLQDTSLLRYEGFRMLTEELREPAVYNTILASIAGGRHKLNELYRHTGFSRAKISVYLKNLMELEIVEKVFSYDTDGYDNAQKGIYRICNRFVHFYYKFIYPHMSSLWTMKPQEYYAEYIKDGLREYVAEYFKEVCKEHLAEWNEQGQLPFIYDKEGEWVGKAGNIDMIVQDAKQHTLLAQCNYDEPVMSYAKYEKLLYYAQKAKLKADYVFLYSVGRFDEKINAEAEKKDNLILVSLKEM